VPTAPAFFVPATSAGEEEPLYARWAAESHLPVPSVKDRVYSITWMHNGTDQWVVTVGEYLAGTRIMTTGRGRYKIEHKLPIEDAARVLAIFPGNPYMVVTDEGASAGRRSYWQSPFVAGNPSRVEYFSVCDFPARKY
jgi:hypothetical protein